MGIKASLSLGTVVVVALVGLSTVFGSWYVIDQTERGVILRNGKMVGTAEPGLNFKAPFITDVERISVQQHKQKFDKLQSYSSDQQPADIKLSVNYHIEPGQVTQVYEHYKDLETLVSRILVAQAPEATENTFGQYTAVSVVKNRDQFGMDIAKKLQTKIQASKAPLIIDSVNVENIDFGEKYEASVAANMQAEVAINTRRQNLETEKINAEIVRTTAQGEADSKLAKAKANAEAVILTGDAEAHALKVKGDAIAANPQLVQLMAIEKWDGELPKQQVPGSAVPFVNLTPNQRIQ
ncbi:prohibitin family protein [Salmonella enterica]|nr:prohibitin family protein [Salmonella enterica]EAO0118488.1 prohibitin family protein [Salmonella enterica]EAO3601708.1 prohibitin family protein [Salmonella enterica]EAR6391605.1 prohibitin family protein [Salmonella enterica]EAV1285250.1 prohibitin family protein [Salmonella enterica]